MCMYVKSWWIWAKGFGKNESVRLCPGLTSQQADGGPHLAAHQHCCGQHPRHTTPLLTSSCLCCVNRATAWTVCLCAGGRPLLASVAVLARWPHWSVVVMSHDAHLLLFLSVEAVSPSASLSLSPFTHVLLIPCDLTYIHRFIMNLFGANGIPWKHKRKGWVSCWFILLFVIIAISHYLLYDGDASENVRHVIRPL